MNVHQVIRIVSGLLILAIAGLLFTGGWQLFTGGAAVWPDVVANEGRVARAAGGMIAMSILLALSAVMVVMQLPRYRMISAVCLGIFVVGSVWGNLVLFGQLNLLHIATNMVVSGLIVVLVYSDKRFGREQ